MIEENEDEGSKNTKGSASQYFVAAELSRRGVIAALTLGNCPNTDILCSDSAGKLFAHIQVKTFPLKKKMCAVGLKAEREFGKRFFWVLVGLSKEADESPIYYVIPSRLMAKHVKASFLEWLKRNPSHDPKNPFRGVRIPPRKNLDKWSIKKYEGRWDLILKRLRPAKKQSQTGSP